MNPFPWRPVLVASLLMWSFLSLPTATPTLISNDHQIRDTTLTVLTYNVWVGFREVPERKSRWLEWMKAQEPDIVFLQELNGYSPDQLQKEAAHWGHSYAALLKEDGFPTGITSRYPIEGVEKWTEGFHHGLMRAKINGMYVYNMHLHPSNWEVRSREIDLLLADVEKLPAGSSILLAGDFNAMSPLDSAFYAHGLLEPFFATLDADHDAQNLRDGKLDYSVLTKLMDRGFVDLEYRMRGSGYTFTGSFPSHIEKPGDHGSRRRLDYAFANEELLPRLLEASIIANDTTEQLSDHLPVIVRFR
jgi:exodeoxyribonuclease-3